MDINNLTLVGRLTSDAELKTVGDGKALIKFSVAVNAGYGEKQTASFFDVSYWPKNMESGSKLNTFLTKGKRVGLTGAIKQDRWQDANGANRSKVVVNCYTLQLLDGGSKDGAAQEPSAPAQTPAYVGEDVPF